MNCQKSIYIWAKKKTLKPAWFQGLILYNVFTLDAAYFKFAYAAIRENDVEIVTLKQKKFMDFQSFRLRLNLRQNLKVLN